MRTKRLAKRKRNFFGMVMGFNNLIFIITAAVFALGVIFGTFMLNGIESSEFERLSGVWTVFGEGGLNNGFDFFDRFLKCGSMVFFIWLCGFIKFGFIGVFFLILVKGLSVGFTSAFVIKCMGAEGILEIFRLYSLWNFALISLCFIIGVFAVRKCIVKNSYDEKRKYYAVGAFMFAGVMIIMLL